MSWRSVTLGDLVDLKYGKGLPEPMRVAGDIPVFGSGGIVGTHNQRYVNGPGIVVGRKGTIGAVYWIDRAFFPIDTVYYVALRDETASLKFIYYLLQHSPLASLNSDAAVPGLNRENALRLKVMAPEPPSQYRIAAILSAYDDLIENNRRRIQLLEQAARLIYREWFVRLRFPGHERARVVDGVPEGWEKTRLGKVAAVNQEQLKSSHQGTIEYVDISSVSPGSIDATQSFEFEMAPGRARRIVRHGDVIWSCVRPNRRSHAIIWNPSPNLVASTGFAVITPRQVPTSYLYYALTTDSFVGYLTNRARGGAYPAVLASDFEDAELLRPGELLVGEFDRLVRPMIDQRANLRLQNEHFRQARDLLLPRLMSGGIEV